MVYDIPVHAVRLEPMRNKLKERIYMKKTFSISILALFVLALATTGIPLLSEIVESYLEIPVFASVGLISRVNEIFFESDSLALDTFDAQYVVPTLAIYSVDFRHSSMLRSTLKIESE